MIVGQVTALKLAWTLAALVGVIVTFALFFMSITDYKLLNHRKLNGWRKQVAITSIFIFMGGFMTQAIYFAAGVLSLTQNNETGSSAEVRHITQALFLLGALGAILLAIIIFYRRIHILEIIEDALRKESDGKSENPPSD